MVSIETDVRQLQSALANLAEAAKVELGPVIKEEARYLLNLFIKFTPPKSRKQGEGAVQSDMANLATPLSYPELEAKAGKKGFYRSMAKYVRNRETEKLKLLFQNPNFKFFHGRQMLSNVDEIRRAHRQRQNRRGRIPKDTNMAAYSSDMKEFSKEIRSRVGWTASGWIPAAKAAGAKYKKFSDRFGDKSGRAASNFVGVNPFFVAINKDVKIPNYQRLIDAAVASRTRTTLRKIAAIGAGRAVNLGFTKVGGKSLPIAA
jgi:soluble cytochrome b562